MEIKKSLKSYIPATSNLLTLNLLKLAQWFRHYGGTYEYTWTTKMVFALVGLKKVRIET